MKRNIQKKTFLFLTVTLILMLAANISVFAGTLNIVQAGSFYELHPDAPTKQYEISGVTGNYDLGIRYVSLNFGNAGTLLNAENMEGCYTATAPVTVKSLDTGDRFGVYKLALNENLYQFDWTDSKLPYSIGTANADGTIPTGCTTTVREPGDYYVYFRYDPYYDMGMTSTLIHIVGEAETKATAPTITNKDTPAMTSSPLKSTPNTSYVFTLLKFNDTWKNLDAYNINGNNYFKLRDLATAVNGTEKQFGIAWDANKKAINLISGSPYFETGTASPATAINLHPLALPNSAQIYRDGSLISLTSYNIGGSNYFKLRDVAKAFNINVTWDAVNETIIVNTKSDYTDAQ